MSQNFGDVCPVTSSEIKNLVREVRLCADRLLDSDGKDPDDILVVATDTMTTMRALETALRPVRQNAIHDLRVIGLTYDQISRIDGLALSRPRIIQIHQGRTGSPISQDERERLEHQSRERDRVRAARKAAVDRVLSKRRG